MAAYYTLSAACTPPLLSLHSSSSSSSHRKRCSFSSAALLLVAGATAAGVVACAPPAALAAALEEPRNALSLPTWVIHVSSVVEWIAAMLLVWEYGELSGFRAWKGLSWGMVLPLASALCACTWHFFYDSESLEVLVALQAGLTVFGNLTMCIAAFRIFKASQGGCKNL
ncbi:uncharacterized protein M6B38_316675 [Iris pallida]|uniref:Ycf49-like protein n=1 Tax=Iris pallida TaxID=29817 RepID=A0AAX6HF30_IRIPA|nr:uncharacterized protein M6B38_316675 [Iris pallida]